MPNRILREGIVTSERVNSLDWGSEVFYRRVMSIVDDYGRCEANAKLLLGSCYAMKLDCVSLVDIEQWLSNCQKANLVVLYEVSGKRYLEICDFRQQIRSKQSKYPSPDSGAPIACAADAQQMQSNAHLVGGVGVVGDVFEDGDGGVGGEPQPLPVETSRAVQIAVFLRSKGIDGANASNPLVDEWSRNPKVTDDLLETAVSMVWARKPTRPGPKYMKPIVEDLLNPKPVEPREAKVSVWSMNDNQLNALGRELGIGEARVGEPRETYIARLQQKQADVRRRAA